MNIILIKEKILNRINEIDKNKKNKYNLKYTNEYYLDMIFLLIDDVVKWISLTNIKNYGNNKKIYKYHYKQYIINFINGLN